MGTLAQMDDEQLMEKDILDFLNKDDPHAQSNLPLVSKSCCALSMIEHNDYLMNSVLITDMLLTIDDMDNEDVSLHINAIKYIYLDIDTGKLPSLSTIKSERDKLRNSYVQEYKRELNTPLAYFEDVKKKNIFQRLLLIT